MRESILLFLAFITIMRISQTSGIFFRHYDVNYNYNNIPYDPNYIVKPDVPSPVYDFVIIGSGSGGSVLARRLSERPEWRILLLEVGKRPTIASDIPFVAPALQFTDFVWNYQMEKTPGVCLGLKDQRCPWPRGRGLGGTTLINYMIYTRGHKKDYDRWAAQGNPGWSYKEVFPYFLKSENANLRFADHDYHWQEGPLSVEDVRWKSKVVDAFIMGGQEMGYPFLDYNGKSQNGFSYIQANTRRGVRDSGYRAFIRPAENRRNLDILTESRATKLLIDPTTKQVYGVEFVRNRRYCYVNVTKEVISAAGAFNSPQLLMLSGIGPKNHLESLGIPVIKDLPVGRNLHDHITFLGMVYVHNGGDTGLPKSNELVSLTSIVDWFKVGAGPLTSIGGVEAIGYLNTNTSYTGKVPDMELLMVNGRFGRDIADILKRSLGLTDEIYSRIENYLVYKPVSIILPMHLKPKSIGYLELKSKNPYHWPRLYGNHLSDPENADVKAFIAAIRFIQKLTKTKAFQRYNTSYIDFRMPNCEQHEYDSDNYWECCVRHISTTLHHQVGTCKMGPESDPTSVVNNELKVHGIKGLRVVDTSVIPFALNAHTNAPTYMVGEKAADYIKNEWK